LFTAAIGATVALLARSPATSGQKFIPGDAAPEESASVPALPSAEYVATKVSPSVVVLQTNIGGDSEARIGDRPDFR
jgi:hypothetical protein